MTELAPLLHSLQEKFPWLVPLATFIGFARILIKPAGNWIKDAITRAAQKALDSKSTWDDHWIELLTDCWPYRLFAFLLDLCASVKLPVLEDLKRNTPPV